VWILHNVVLLSQGGVLLLLLLCHVGQYPGMHAHLAAAGLAASVAAAATDDTGNQWDRPVHVHSRPVSLDSSGSAGACAACVSVCWGGVTGALLAP
jgi:hypothetical protein